MVVTLTLSVICVNVCFGTSIQKEFPFENKVFLNINHAYNNNTQYKVISSLQNNDFSREKIRLSRLVDSGHLHKNEVDSKLNEIINRWKVIQHRVKILESKVHISPCLTYSKRSDLGFIDLSECGYYDFDGKRFDIEYPSQLISRLELELYLGDYYFNTSGYKKEFDGSSIQNNYNKSLICVFIDRYFGYKEGHPITIKWYYLDIKFLKKKILFRRHITYGYLNPNFDENSSSFDQLDIYLDKYERQKIVAKYILYAHNNSPYDYYDKYCEYRYPR